MTDQDPSQRVEEEMAQEIRLREKLDKNYYYEAKRASIIQARELGLSDEEIELALNIDLRPEDRSST